MKKILSILGLLAVFTMATPVFAAPPGGHHGGGPAGRHMHGGGHRVQAGVHHRHHARPHHGGITVHTGHYPRHSYWGVHRTGYWCSPWCNYRLGHCPYHGYGVHIPMGGASFSVRF